MTAKTRKSKVTKPKCVEPPVPEISKSPVSLGLALKLRELDRALFAEFGLDLPPPTKFLVALSQKVVKFWWTLPLIPIGIWLTVNLVCMFRAGRMGFHQFLLKTPIVGMLIEKNILARTTRTLGTLVASGVPILEGLTITRETAGNAMFERMYSKVADAIREG